MIVYELLAGQPAFPKWLKQHQIPKKVAVDDERPEIPEFVLPDTRNLITDCWASDRHDRPSFKDIVFRLVEMKFKLIANVNSLKLSTFVKEIKEMEAQDGNE